MRLVLLCFRHVPQLPNSDPVSNQYHDTSYATYRSIVPPSTCCKIMTTACFRSQLFLLSNSNTASIKSQIGAENELESPLSPPRGFRSPLLSFKSVSSGGTSRPAALLCRDDLVLRAWAIRSSSSTPLPTIPANSAACRDNR